VTYVKIRVTTEINTRNPVVCLGEDEKMIVVDALTAVLRGLEGS
jgi:hypothetical protein